MQYIVPQDIEVEDKIIGPLSLRQFGYMLAGGGFAFAFYSFFNSLGLPSFIGWFFALFPFIGFISLAFVPYNGRNIDTYIYPLISYLTSPKQLIWQKDMTLDEIEIISTENKEEKEQKTTGAPAIQRKKSLLEERSRIQQLANIIDGGNLVVAPEVEPITFFDSKSQASNIDKLISETSKSVPEPEPAISSLASVTPTQTFTESLPDTSEYAFSAFENRVKEARAELDAHLASAKIIKREGVRLDEGTAS